ncbi:hypothetical protein [Streptomyces mashuensis]|nr:hypothetical protein [Streptomyces mashuensis]
MDRMTREAAQAVRRLMAVTRAALEDPARSEAALSAAAHEAHEAMRRAGLLHLSDGEVLALVAQLDD